MDEFHDPGRVAVNLTSSTSGLLFAAVGATCATVAMVIAAHKGSPQLRASRAMMAVAIAAIAASYWLDFDPDVDATVAEMRRGAGWVLWPAITWYAVLSTRQWLRVVAVAERREAE